MGYNTIGPQSGKHDSLSPFPGAGRALKRAWLICHKISGRIGGRIESAPLPHPLYPVLRDLCVTRAAARLNVILSPSATLRINYAKNPKGFITRQRSFASKGFGFFTSLRSVQNDSKSASADIPRAVMQRSRMTGRAGRSNSRVELGSDGSTVPVTPITVGAGVVFPGCVGNSK